MELPIPFRSNPGAFATQGNAKLINCYAQQEGPDNKAQIVLRSHPGLKRFGNDALSPCRGMIFVEEDDLIYTANGFQLYKKESDGTLTSLTIIPGEDTAYFARNDAAAPLTVLVAGQRAYEITEGAATYKGYDFTPLGVTFCGGRFVFWDTLKFYYSDINSSSVSGLSFFEAEGDPDGITKAHGSINRLYLVGKRTIEVWGVTSDADAPFGRVGGAHFRFGSESPHSIKDFNNGVAVVGNDNVVYLLNGLQYEPFSSNEVTELIAAEADKSKIVATVYTLDQNKFYCLHGTGWTREYNATTQSWHDRSTLSLTEWDSVHYVRAWGKDIFGSRSLGLFSEIDRTLYTENGDPLVYGFQTANIHAFPQGISFNSLTLAVETGDTAISSDEAYLMFDWSDDDGRTWSQERFLPIGAEGEYNKRVRAYGLGQCGDNGRIFRVRISDPVIRGVSLAEVDASPVAL